MLPLTTILLCLGAVRSPDGAALYFASLFPLTSMTGMPVRIMQGYVPVHELCLGLAVLMLALALLRRSARSAYVNASVGS
ncbi:ABC-type Na+ efflux pump permease subunit [Stenotrophomonas sp. SORGH_AS321]|nr:ABC-type Na+ efflux pump permease subunit [Stenotrophomonas sp. SORGH_AS_0321]